MTLPRALISDRRGSDRHPMRAPAALVLGDGRSLPARLLDIGKGGAGLVCDWNVPVGTRLVLRTNLPARPKGSAGFEAEASVVNTTLAGRDGGFRLGLQFDTLSAAAQAALAGAI